MSIKQSGGVFGRNPTFNDVTIEGQLTFDGDIDINSDLKVDGDLDVTGKINTDTYLSVTAGSPNIRLIESDTTDENYRIRGQSGQLIFEKITDAASVVAESFRIDASNDIKISSGNLVIATSGKGIDFSATSGTGTSELFDDYEEGAFVCTINGAVEPATLITSTGYYTKIGRDVFFQVSFESVDTTGYSGTLSFSGLPFVSASTFGRSITNIIQYSGATYTGSPVGEISSNSSIVNARTDVSGAPWGVMSHNAGSGRFFWITGSYKT